jgi:predicted esterase
MVLMPDAVVRTIETTIHGRVIVRPAARPSGCGLLVGFHGYGENAERHLADLERIPGIEDWTLAAVQGLHRFYRSKSEEVVASWMTRQDREAAIADNVEYVNRVVNELWREHDPAALVFAGFSQGVAMAFRAAVLGVRPADGVIALGGDVPPELKAPGHRPFPPVLIGRGLGDPWYTEQKLAADIGFLKSHAARVQPLLFEGGHEWTDAFRAGAAHFLGVVS